MPVTLDDFCSRLAASKLFSADEVSSFLSLLTPRERLADGDSLATRLIDAGKLTRFQAEQLCALTGDQLVLGNYIILDKLGQGGMGAVYKAQHRHMKRLVALKVISPALLNSSNNMKRFQREVETLARLKHPNIVVAHDAAEAEGTKFLVMELVEGRDLSSQVRASGPLPVGQAVDCILQAARGLAYAHRQGVVHRDVKPSNLFLDQAGVVKILDLGLASLSCAERDESLTDSGVIVGTLEYLSPEQAQSPKLCDPRSDVYSLGLTLWYLLTGRAAFEAKSAVSMLLAHRDRPLPSLPAIRADVPPALGALFHRMAAKQMSDRYQTMDDVVAALEGLQSDLGSTANAAVSPIVLLGDTRPIRKTGNRKLPVAPPGNCPTDRKIGAWRQVRRPLFTGTALVVGCIAIAIALLQLGSGVGTAIEPNERPFGVASGAGQQVRIGPPRIAVGSITENAAPTHRNRGALGD
jgi:serine/threonine protein kinase